MEKKDLSPELQSLAAPAIEAECISAFVGEREWPNDGNDICVNTTETEQERGARLGGGERNKENQEEVKEDGLDNWISRARQDEKPRRELAKEVQLLPGERLGWWSEQKFDRRVRMRTLVNGADTDDAWKSKEPQKGGPRQLAEPPSRSVWAGNEFTFSNCGSWITHYAGVDVVLGTDFMIPAGIRLDLFQANVKLPDEVVIPLIKTMGMLDEPDAPQTKEGPTESSAIPGR
ncbi:unnamed protein product [Phytophthora fragariaefolia]|uniref:Unnamed protein product n=1 Tax=Phytophthora fragariaefolia TaxID=1490495 RepID=A0A9W6Y317_9STRA|nr:unnamed protein product [Phytophthora fragariaefolia]